MPRSAAEMARKSKTPRREEVSTFVTGDRFGSVVDPFGQRWTGERVEDVSKEEADRRLAAWASDDL